MESHDDSPVKFTKAEIDALKSMVLQTRITGSLSEGLADNVATLVSIVGKLNKLYDDSE